MDQLQLMNFDVNGLYGTIPPELCKLARLELLWFGGGYLGGTLPACIGDDLTRLHTLRIGSTTSNFSYHWRGVPHVAGINGTIPESFANLVNYSLAPGASSPSCRRGLWCNAML